MEARFVTAESQDFRDLAAKLDAYYFEVVGDVQLRYAAYNDPKHFDRLLVVYEGEIAVACGCWKQIDPTTAEMKRLYVLPAYRRRGIATLIMTTLEQDAAAAGFRHFILETARTTMDSAALYLSLGYHEIDYYGSPAGAEFCRCFEKNL